MRRDTFLSSLPIRLGRVAHWVSYEITKDKNLSPIGCLVASYVYAVACYVRCGVRALHGRSVLHRMPYPLDVINPKSGRYQYVEGIRRVCQVCRAKFSR